MSRRAPVLAAPGPLEDFSRAFDNLLDRRSQRDAFRRHLEGLLLPSERSKTLTALSNTEPVTGATKPQAQKTEVLRAGPAPLVAFQPDAGVVLMRTRCDVVVPEAGEIVFQWIRQRSARESVTRQPFHIIYQRRK